MNCFFCIVDIILPIENSGEPHKKPIIIGDNVWVGTGAIILPGVKISEMSVVATGAVVTIDVPPYTVVGSVPAKVIKYLGDQ